MTGDGREDRNTLREALTAELDRLAPEPGPAGAGMTPPSRR
ncbi:hypothetical protein [Streptomyces cyslabdanicus]